MLQDDEDHVLRQEELRLEQGRHVADEASLGKPHHHGEVGPVGLKHHSELLEVARLHSRKLLAVRQAKEEKNDLRRTPKFHTLFCLCLPSLLEQSVIGQTALTPPLLPLQKYPQ